MRSPRRSAALSKIGASALVIAVGVGVVAAVTATVNSRASAATQTYPIPASGTFAVSGHGNGHGHGMSQWGAEGAAVAGLSAAQIVAFYYPNTTLTTLAPSTVRVLISDDGGATTVAAKAGLSLTGYGALPSAGVAQWKLVPYQSGLALLRESSTGAWSNAKLGLPAQADFSSADGFVRLYHADGSFTDYRGTVGSVRSGGAELTVNRVPLDDYVMGVAPRESPSSWRPAAEQAQAIAARSYARYAVEHDGGDPYDICDTSQCQVYGGMAAYSASGALLYTDYPAAISGNQNEVLTYAGATIFAQFSASDGGWTTGGGEPYLTAHADPYDTAAAGDPWADWSRTVSGSSVASYYGLARVTAIEVTSRDGNGDWGGRVLAGFVDGVGSGGQAEQVSVTGSDLAAAMGLPQNWFTILTAPPLGHLDSVTQTGEHTWTVKGWAYDPTSASAATQVDAYVGSSGVALSADLPRPDVQAAYNLPNAAHGFAAEVTVPSGTFQLCLYALSADGSTHSLLGCRAVTSGPPPVGVVDSMTPISEHSWRVTGWTFDPGALTASTPVSVQVGPASTPG
ncbi:MAG TPA: SpoIID/LytB domain-containing protein, partial [Jatrophihabitantaceae bacterium]|nr:SpoIID/LytB domain-containing protein [Jatrophihabitantaceae bacterium]